MEELEPELKAGLDNNNNKKKKKEWNVSYTMICRKIHTPNNNNNSPQIRQVGVRKVEDRRMNLMQ